MLGIYLNHHLTNAQLRKHIFQGKFLLQPANEASLALCGYAQYLIHSYFDPLLPESAQYHLPVEEFVKIITPLKKEFTNGLDTKKLLRQLLLTLGFDKERTYFDVPRLRVAPADHYLSAGVSYAYKPHRDTWYAAPDAQINFWMPVFEISPEAAMAIYPQYWNKPIENSSANFDYDQWCLTERPKAETLLKEDNRQHPLPLEKISNDQETRIAGNQGDLLIFSAAHLHGSATNQSGKTRFSIDFRVIDMEDLEKGLGAPNVDNQAKGSILKDYVSLADFSPLILPREIKYAQTN